MVIIAADSNNAPKFLKTDTDDDNVAKDQEAQVVICLNYVWDDTAGNWVRMTQPT